jgi:peroxiredoxin
MLAIQSHRPPAKVVIHGRQPVAQESFMPLQQSAMVPLGTKMPAFTLPDVVSGRTIASDTLDASRPVLVLFICGHCPFTRHIAPALRTLGQDYGDRVQMIAISGNDPQQVPEDSPEGLARVAREIDLKGPFLYDESQTIVRAFGAECTPECYLYDTSGHLVYRGQIDGSRPGSGTSPTAAPLRAALDALLSGAPIDANQKPGVGCNVKWRAAVRPGAGVAAR